MTATITVENSFGREVQMTRAQFVERWVNHISPIDRLHPSMSQGECKMIIEIVKARADQEFTRLYAEEHNLMNDLIKSFEEVYALNGSPEL